MLQEVMANPLEMSESVESLSKQKILNSEKNQMGIIKMKNIVTKILKTKWASWKWEKRANELEDRWIEMSE